ncbi:MAG: MFS transporter [Anaerolineaceae bacterium]
MEKSMQLTEEKQAKRERLAWYLYDFGNSAYAGVVLLAVYSAYFKGTVVGGARGTWLWGLSIGIAMLVVAVISPILGSLADFSASKKKFLFIFTAISVFFTAMLFFVTPGSVFTGMLFFILAEIGYRGGQVFYNSLLPEISTPEDMDKVSGNGWAIGSAGGVLCLLIVLALIMLIGGNFIIRISLVITAVFFAVSTIPLFAWYKEKASPQQAPKGSNYIKIAFSRLMDTFRAVKTQKEFIKFVIAFLIYNDGVLMMLDFAAIIGAVLFGMDQQQLIIMMLIVQVTSVAGAYVFGHVADKYNGKVSLIISILAMLATVIILMFVQSLVGFIILAGFAGFVLTGVQSVSRGLVGQFAPNGKSGEFYGLFAVAGRTSSFIGPTLYGWLAVAAASYFVTGGQSALLAEQSGQRVAIASIGVFLIVGLAVLLSVHIPKKRVAEISA